MARFIFLIALANFVLLVSCTGTSKTDANSGLSETETSSNSKSYSSSNDSSDIPTNDDSNEEVASETEVEDIDEENDEVDETNDEVANSDEVVEKSEEAIDDSDEVVETSKEAVDNSDDEVDNSDDVVENSDEEVDSSSGSDDDSGDNGDENEPAPTCGDNEILDECPVDCPSDNCPKCENEPQSCPRPTPCPKSECKCSFNYRRAENGTCIPTESCPPFECSGENEEYNACPPLCPSDSCSQASPTGRCPIIGRIGIRLQCIPKCRCIKGYWRKDGKCVPYEECPGSCPANEVYSECKNGLRRPLNCSQADQVNTCLAKRRGHCEKGCVCKKKYLRGYNGTCVPQDECESTKFTCPPNEKEDDCANAICRAQKCSQKGNPVACPGVSECIRDCVCEENFLRAENGTCIPEDQCPQPVCTDSEVVDNCPADCPSDYCPKNEAEDLTCITPDECPPPSCKCRFNYRKVDNGTCVPTRECPPFDCSGPNEEFDPCPPLCPSDDCSQASTDGQCHRIGRIGIVLPCNPKCRCIKNYWRKNGVCVPYEECLSESCPPNEVYSKCIGNECRALNCSQKNDDILCKADDNGPCETGCICQEGFLRAENGTCVEKDQCEETPVCSDYEVVDKCPVDCPSDYCPKSDGENQTCVKPAVCPPPACKCGFNLRRAENGTCIPTLDCRNKCPANEEYSECISEVGRALNCSQINESGPYSKKRKGPCEKGCVCQENYLRDETGACVPKDDCIKLQCGDNEVEAKCPADCPSDKCPKGNDQDQTCVSPEVCPAPVCKCSFNHRRAENGTCIPTKDCPPFDCSARPNEEYDPCPPLCPSDSCDQASPDGVCPPLFGNILITLPCEPKCRCIKNYWRKDGVCVPYGDCPNVCPANEVYSDCINATCKRLNCTQEVDSKNCNPDAPYEKGCVCQDNYIRAENGTCIPEDQCEKPKPVCSDDEVLNECPSDCPSDYCPKSESDENKICTKPKTCPPAVCKCRFNFRRAENGTCIPTRSCPPFDCTSRPNERYDPCPALCPSEDCSQAKLHGRCPFTIKIILHCKPKCRCIKDHHRRDGICVPYGECPGICPINEEYSECINKIRRPLNCSQTEVTYKTENNDPCETGCICKENYLRNDNGTCVPKKECTNGSNSCSKPNEDFDSCKSACSSELCSSIVSRFACPDPEPPCKSGCFCKSGYFRVNATEPCGPVCDCPEMSGSLDCKKKQ